jgi:hypothetical protein
MASGANKEINKARDLRPEQKSSASKAEPKHMPNKEDLKPVIDTKPELRAKGRERKAQRRPRINRHSVLRGYVPSSSQLKQKINDEHLIWFLENTCMQKPLALLTKPL